MTTNGNFGDDSNYPIKKLSNNHPQIKEKAIFDYVNGLEILGDQLRVRKKINNSFFQRTWNLITGQAAQRQQLIDLNVTTSLNSFSICLQDLQLSQAESDLTIAHLADKLFETREGIMLLKEKQQDLLKNVFEFQSKVNYQLEGLKSKVLHTEKGLLGYVHLEQVFDKWGAGHLNVYPPLARLFLVMDELYWGNFGTFCRISPKQEEVNELWKQLENKALVQMKQDLGENIDKIMLFQEWLSPIQSLPEDLREMIVFLSDWAQPENSPVIWAMRDAALPKNYFPKPKVDLPQVLSGDRLIARLIYENKKR